MLSPKSAITTILSALFFATAAMAIDNKPPVPPPPPPWPPLAEDDIYVIQVKYPTDSVGEKVTRQIVLNKKDCERNGNRTDEKENANSFITVECHADGSILVQRRTLNPIGFEKQELSLPAIGTSRFEFLQGSKSYPDIKINVSRQKRSQP